MSEVNGRDLRPNRIAVHWRTKIADCWTWFFGFSAGVLGGAYGMNGPSLAVYGALRHWSPEQFRATLQGYFLPVNTTVLGGGADTLKGKGLKEEKLKEAFTS